MQEKLNRCKSRNDTRLDNFLAMTFDPDQPLLGPLFLENSLGMLFGPRGSGKSLLALYIAYAIAGKKKLPPWGTGAGLPVAIFDGEMRAGSLRERLELIHASNSDEDSTASAGANLYIFSRDALKDAIGCIDTEDGQRRIDARIPHGVKLIVIDNLSAWTTSGKEDSASWATIKAWLINKRIQGISVLLIHHSGKSGTQRGSSAHEDLLDYSISLAPLASSTERVDTRFSIKHTKLRDFIPDLRHQFDFSIWSEDGKLKFESVAALQSIPKDTAEMLRLRGDGLSVEAIANTLGVHKSTVSRRLAKHAETWSDDEHENASEP